MSNQVALLTQWTGSFIQKPCHLSFLPSSFNKTSTLVTMRLKICPTLRPPSL